MKGENIFFAIFGGIIVLIFLIYAIAHLIDTSARTYELKKTDFEKKELELNHRVKNKEQELENENQRIEELKTYYEKVIRDFDQIIEAKCKFYPQLAGAVADIKTLYYARIAKFLETKPHPAIEEAKRIRELRHDTKEILAQYKEASYQLEYIRALFPNIDDIFEDGFETNVSDDFLDEENVDRVRYFLSPEDYKNLCVTERNQLALDNYLRGRKSKWQIGRDFEMSTGYQYHLKGYDIEYTGIIKKLEDMGRDIIARKQNEILIIQCKNWSKEKTIHEKHIFQLYGTVVLYELSLPFSLLSPSVKGIFITTTSLSNKAKEVAKFLQIDVVENCEIQEFPRIKCNINETTKEKIYHLPFDQQYDSTKINEDKGECYAFTVIEAEDKGFRRAFKWHGD